MFIQMNPLDHWDDWEEPARCHVFYHQRWEEVGWKPIRDFARAIMPSFPKFQVKACSCYQPPCKLNFWDRCLSLHIPSYSTSPPLSFSLSLSLFLSFSFSLHGNDLTYNRLNCNICSPGWKQRAFMFSFKAIIVSSHILKFREFWTPQFHMWQWHWNLSTSRSSAPSLENPPWMIPVHQLLSGWTQPNFCTILGDVGNATFPEPRKAGHEYAILGHSDPRKLLK